MPEYLAPGVYIEEVDSGGRSIEGVSTSTAGFVGMARYGPVYYPGGPANCEPQLLTSFSQFEGIYGGLNPLYPGADAGSERERMSYLSHAVRTFFENGGRRLYISRVFAPRHPRDDSVPDLDKWGIARRSIDVGDITATWKARWPGSDGNVQVETEVVRSQNIARLVADAESPAHGLVQTDGAAAGAVVEVLEAGAALPAGNDDLDVILLRVVRVDVNGVQTFITESGAEMELSSHQIVRLIELKVRITIHDERVDEYRELGASPLDRRDIAKILQLNEPENQNSMIWLDRDPNASSDGNPKFLPARLMAALQQNPSPGLENGHDGALVSPDEIKGLKTSPHDNSATGLEALAKIEDISIVAAPAEGGFEIEEARQVAERLIDHAERQRYRFALIDAPQGCSISNIRNFRASFDSSYAALYHPWVEIPDPGELAPQGTPPRHLSLPPSGFIAGIYARNDVERGVHKAPANETMRGAVKLESAINTTQGEVLNSEGINALRFFDGLGHQVWGARTASSDPEWKYINTRRLFIFLEHSIDKGTQWAVFEPNNEALWSRVRRSIEHFLLIIWRNGALMGAKPEEAFFVRCDESTMTQNNLDNGRLICLVGVAPVRPAEFVIFRIGQWTSDSKQE